MPKVSRASASRSTGPARRGPHEELDGYTVSFVSLEQDMDLAPLLKGLPDDCCPCPHWGYVLQGADHGAFGDHQEVDEAGDAFYMSPGHAPQADAGTEFVQFSPADELRATEAAITKNMQERQGA